MEKKVFLKTLVALTGVLFLVSCQGQEKVGADLLDDEQTLYIDHPEESDLAFWLGDELKREEMSDHTILPGWFGAEEYLDGRYEAIYVDDFAHAPEVAITYLFAGYPDVLDTWKVTKITITDPSISVYGLNLLSEKEEIDEEMTSRGFKEEETSSKAYYTLGRIAFSFGEDSIIISAASTNKDNIIY